MEKLAFLVNLNGSSWKSCQVIAKNLMASYNQALDPNSFKVFDFNEHTNPFLILELARELKEFGPDKIVFLDHAPHPYFLINELDELYSKDRPTLYFHVYGDFVFFANKWELCSDALSRFKNVFICASDKQVSLVRKLIFSPENVVFKCPFPIDKNDNYYSPEIRKEWREENKLKDDEKVFLYTGRLSLQKNSLEMIVDFANMLMKSHAKAKLWLAGGFDDLGIPYIGKVFPYNRYYWQFKQLMKSLPVEIQKNIHYAGNLESDELIRIHNGCDYFISTSVHNDEDFGISPAEALCCGLPAVLTDWGGYTSFKLKDAPGACELIPVTIGDERITYSRNLFMKHMFKRMTESWDDKMRTDVSKKYQAAFSIEACAEILKDIHARKIPDFHGFSLDFEMVSKRFEIARSEPFANKDKGYSDLYKDLYSVY